MPRGTPLPFRDPSVSATQVWDLRALRELRTYRGHTKDVLCAAWHPVHEELFASGGYDGSLLYWLASRPGPQVLQQYKQ